MNSFEIQLRELDNAMLDLLDGVESVEINGVKHEKKDLPVLIRQRELLAWRIAKQSAESRVYRNADGNPVGKQNWRVICKNPAEAYFLRKMRKKYRELSEEIDGSDKLVELMKHMESMVTPARKMGSMVA